MIIRFFNTVILLFCISLIGCKTQTSDDFIVFDVNGNYPVKTLNIEDVADIEYLTLEVKDDFLFKYYREMTDNYIICSGDKELIFFDRSTGKVASKISRYGNGPGEYTTLANYVYDEKNDELFNWGMFGITVYGRDGTFKREFSIGLPYSSYIFKLYDFDEDNLLLYGFPSRLFVFDDDGGQMKDTTFMLVSKQDGFTDVIPIPFEERISIVMSQGNVGGFVAVNPAIRNGNDFLLTDYSSDTVYRFTSDRQLIPVLVREPTIQKMNTKIFLHSWLETDKFLFFSTQKNEYDLITGNGCLEKGYMMEKKSGNIFQTNVLMKEYKGKELILGPSVIYKTSGHQTGIIAWNVAELHEANEEKKLSGKLKNIIDRLTRDDEYVFMILNFK